MNSISIHSDQVAFSAAATTSPIETARADAIDHPVMIGPVKVKNRLFKPAMSEQLADRNGNPKIDLIAALYRRWAQGGVGMMSTGNIMVDRDALGEPSNIVLDGASDLSAFRQWVDGARVNGTVFIAQLNHPGKQVPKFLNSQPMAPSPIPIQGPLANGFNPPREMTSLDIWRVINQFTTAARLAKLVGFDGIQLHGAHGYLINQFLSPRHNQRTDEWGEPTRFLMKLYSAVRAEVGPDFPVTIKLNSSDFEKGGYSEQDALAVMKQLEAAGIDAIEVSGGTYESQAMTGEGQGNGGYFVEFARGAKAQLRIPVIVTGGFQRRTQIVDALNDGVDMVGVGRPLILDPDMPNKLMAGDQATFRNHMQRSGCRQLDIVSMLSWFELQMLRLARGKRPEPEMHAARAAWHAMTHVGLKAFAPRRG